MIHNGYYVCMYMDSVYKHYIHNKVYLLMCSHVCMYVRMYVCVYVCMYVGVHPADQADSWAEEGGCGQLQCPHLLADTLLHVLHLHSRESHQALPHHAHQEVSTPHTSMVSITYPKTMSMRIHKQGFI